LAAAATANFVPPAFAWGVLTESQLGKAILEFTNADRALQDHVPTVLAAMGTSNEMAVIGEVAALATRLAHGMDELAICVKNYHDA
jgi:hypothetical protein